MARWLDIMSYLLFMKGTTIHTLQWAAVVLGSFGLVILAPSLYAGVVLPARL